MKKKRSRTSVFYGRFLNGIQPICNEIIKFVLDGNQLKCIIQVMKLLKIKCATSVLSAPYAQ